mmetsp:Transcript_36397/g.88157  ORF Transcript_36397/g.88157 Transcript_36397/m.88157 type:complete len:247 (-) Transcript_36397:75-815(-)
MRGYPMLLLLCCSAMIVPRVLSFLPKRSLLGPLPNLTSVVLSTKENSTAHCLHGSPNLPSTTNEGSSSNNGELSSGPFRQILEGTKVGLQNYFHGVYYLIRNLPHAIFWQTLLPVFCDLILTLLGFLMNSIGLGSVRRFLFQAWGSTMYHVSFYLYTTAPWLSLLDIVGWFCSFDSSGMLRGIILAPIVEELILRQTLLRAVESIRHLHCNTFNDDHDESHQDCSTEQNESRLPAFSETKIQYDMT